RAGASLRTCFLLGSGVSLRGLRPPRTLQSLRDDPIDDLRVYEPRANAHAGQVANLTDLARVEVRHADLRLGGCWAFRAGARHPGRPNRRATTPSTTSSSRIHGRPVRVNPSALSHLLSTSELTPTRFACLLRLRRVLEAAMTAAMTSSTSLLSTRRCFPFPGRFGSFPASLSRRASVSGQIPCRFAASLRVSVAHHLDTASSTSNGST